MNNKSLNQLLCAALVDNTFCETLLGDPDKAISGGYLDHIFHLTPEQTNMLTKIRAECIEEFALSVYQWINSGHAQILSENVVEIQKSSQFTQNPPTVRMVDIPQHVGMHQDVTY